MNKNIFSPYIRTAMYSTLAYPFSISRRVIFDYEIIYVLDGECKITIDDIPYICKKNDVVFLHPGIEHSFDCIEEKDFIQPHIHFDITYDKKSEDRFISFKSKESLSECEFSLIQKDVLTEINIPYVFIPDKPEKFKHIFFDIIHIYQKKEYNYEILYKSKMLELLNCIFTQFDNTKLTEKTTDDLTIYSVKNYIDNNFLSIISLDSLADQFHINKFTLMRNFKTTYNQRIISYYRQKRIDYAKNILVTSHMSIQQLAEKLNFTDIYSFSRFFKTFIGCSPSQYRKNNTH